MNSQHVKLVKFQGEFVWHHHDMEDELFLVVKGRFRMDYKDDGGVERSLDIGEGEFVIVPRGTEHRPFAEREVAVMLFEPAGTVNTGNAGGALTADGNQRVCLSPWENRFLRCCEILPGLTAPLRSRLGDILQINEILN
ncbi:MAG TPA: cupin domain-containing protein [Bryobacteraceae bacterium]|nr:cupin domain-containing protein [Bryobacteraceae bacterium]